MFDGAISVISIAITWILALAIGFYLLYTYNGNIRKLIKIIPNKYQKDTKIILKKINNELSKYVRGLLLVQFIVFIMYAVIYWLIGHEAFILLALIGAITDVIPFIGPYIGGGIATVIGFTISPKVGYLTIISTIIMQLIEENILSPIIMSKTMKLHPVTIITSLLIFGYLWGIIGMIFATPLAATIKVIFNHFNKKHQFIR